MTTTRSRIVVHAVAAAVGALAAALLIGAPHAHADPNAPCGVAGAPPCAPLLNNQQMCALIAWRTLTPCNWYGIPVPQNTPGSWG